MKAKQYDIFISYRRSSYDTANLIATRLKAEGYSVFFDMETLRSGAFNEQLYTAIEQCRDFIVVLPPDALDRCFNEDDWVRLEVLHALKHSKNIVPVMLNGFVWPEPMPLGLEPLQHMQALTASSVEYFDLAMQRLQERYLLSKPHVQVRKLARRLTIWLTALAALVAILWGVFFVLSRDVCDNYASSITRDAAAVHLIAEQHYKFQQQWDEFVVHLSNATRAEQVEALKEDIMLCIDYAEEGLTKTWYVQPDELQIGAYHSFLLSLNGIEAKDVASSPLFATIYFNDYVDLLDSARAAATQGDSLNLEFVAMYLKVTSHSLNSYYAAILSELSQFPKSSRGLYEDLKGEWIHYPTYEIDRNRAYYEEVMAKENSLAEELMSTFEQRQTQASAEIDDMEREFNAFVEQTDQAIEQLTGMSPEEAEAWLAAENQIDSIRRANDAEIALRREKVEAKRMEVRAMEAELEELDKQYRATYDDLKAKCRLNDEDDQWYKWGKVCRWGAFINMMVESRRELLAQDIRPSSSITPDAAYADMSALLRTYEAYHPESSAYVAAAREFFRELSRGDLRYGGVLIFAFKDDATHPLFRVGDIVTEYNGRHITDYSSFRAAYQECRDGEVEFLRLEDGRLKAMSGRLEQSDIVGFLELTEEI